MAKRVDGELVFLTVERHASIKRGTLQAILEGAGMSVERLLKLI